MVKGKIFREFLVVRSYVFRSETDNEAKLRQDVCDINIGATSQPYRHLAKKCDYSWHIKKTHLLGFSAW